jgi:hypothetical protein
MALTCDFEQAIMDYVQLEPVFCKALLNEAASLFLNGEPGTARLILRDLANARVRRGMGGAALCDTHLRIHR